MKNSHLSFWRRGLTACALTLACFSQAFSLPTDLDPVFGIYQPAFGVWGTRITSVEMLPHGGIVFAGYGIYDHTGLAGFIYRPTLERFFPGPPTGSLPDETCRSRPYFLGTYQSVAVQPDGKVVAAGTAQPMGSFFRHRYLIVRCNADGTADTSFNGIGVVNGHFAPTNETSEGDKVLLRPDGKILLTGTYQADGETLNFAAVQYNSDGTLDTSFGQQGKVVAGFAGDVFLRSAALQPDGKIVLAGGLGRSFVLARLLPDGSPDTSFGRRGKVQTFLNDEATPQAVKLQPDGKIVAAGYSGVDAPDNAHFAIVRYHPDGSLDQSFGAKGVVISNFTNSEGAADIELQPNGKMLVCGNTAATTYGSNLTVARYYPNGSLDLSFGKGGMIAPSAGSCDSMRLQNNGMIIAAGSRDYAHQLAVRLKGGERAETVRFDFDGDGKADISGFRPSNSNWNLLRSTSGSTSIHWGLPTDILVPADYDGDGKTNVAVYRDGAWKIVWSDGSYHQTFHGETGDLPRPGDFDGDGKADIALWRPSNGNWYWINSSDGQYKATHFGMNGDVPLIADFDGDGQTEHAVFRPSEGNWYYLRSSDGQYAATHFGTTGDIPVVGDFDGDGKTDLSVFRPSNSFWYRLDSSNGQYFAQKFGTTGDVPAAADYDGDNKADLAVFRPSNSVWYILQSGNGLTGTLYGAAGDRPVPSVFLP